MSDVATALQRLIIAAEEVLSLRNAGEPAQIDTICSDVLTWFAKPVDGARVVHRYTIQLAEAVACAAHARRHGRSPQDAIYFRIIGVILPDVRADFGVAIEQRKRPTA